ncbi:MAG: alpha-amylase, partial [Ignavibacteriae bacterium]
MTPLIRSLRHLLTQQLSDSWHPYTVPGAWLGGKEPITFPSAASYLLHQLDIIEAEERRRRHRSWSLDHAVVYNAMVRHVTSYDHGPGVQTDGWRNTGTFLKMIGLIPYLMRLGIDTLVLMPINEVGMQGKKGTLGSPYAVRHPLHIEQTLAEPSVGMSVEDQARVMVECLHAAGIKVVLETVLRTASIDSELVPLHPEWFYWIDEEKLAELQGGFQAPHFTSEQLADMKDKVQRGDLRSLPEPSVAYQELFAAPPRRVERDHEGWKGIGPKGTILRIPGAFADWPADDPQPAWSDVTYLRMHDHPHYRYMAYNTVRMYERELDTDEYRTHPLWNTIAAVIPYYVRNLNIDGAMIDMGHALPRDLRRKVMKEARAAKSGLLLFEENFSLTSASKEAGYDAAIGYLPLEASDPAKLSSFVSRVANDDIPTRFFATPESHNTKRATAFAEDP